MYSQIMRHAPCLQGGERICGYCGNSWQTIGCPQHVLFACPKIQHVSFMSWELFGPGTVTNIDVSATAWTDYVRRIAANPFQRVTGILLQIKLVYLGCLIEAYGDTKLLTELESNRNDQAYNGEGKKIMQKYKRWCRNRYNGDAAIAMERLRKKTHKAHFGVCIYFFWGVCFVCRWRGIRLWWFLWAESIFRR